MKLIFISYIQTNHITAIIFNDVAWGPPKLHPVSLRRPPVLESDLSACFECALTAVLSLAPEVESNGAWEITAIQISFVSKIVFWWDTRLCQFNQFYYLFKLK